MLSQTNIRTFLKLQPILPISQWWQLLILIFGLLGILEFVLRIYIRDSRDLPAGLTTLLTTLRLIAFSCILIYVLNPGKRTETRILKTSRLAILINTSLSMGLKDQTSTDAPLSQGLRRIDSVVDWLDKTPEIEALRQEHELSFYRFGDQPQPESITTLPKLGTEQAPQRPLKKKPLLN